MVNIIKGCSNCEQLQDRIDKIFGEKKTLERALTDVKRKVIELTNENKSLRATIEQTDNDPSPAPDSASWPGEVESAIEMLARVVRKLMANHKSERSYDKIEEHEERFIERLAK
jgi:hypothetical protein